MVNIPRPVFLNSYKTEFPAGFEELVDGKLDFSALDGYARFLLEHKLDEMVS